MARSQAIDRSAAHELPAPRRDEEQLHVAPGNEAEQELVEHRQIRSDVIDAQRDALAAMRDRGAIDDDVMRNIERELDLEEIRMEA